MKIMADLDAVHLGLDENEADIAEELQDFDDSFDTRSEASESGSESSDSQPSISSVSSAPSSIADKRKTKVETKKKEKNSEKKTTKTVKRAASPNAKSESVNGKNSIKKKKESDNSTNVTGQKPPAESSAEVKKLTNNTDATKRPRKKSASSSTTNNATVNNNTPAATANVSSNKSDASDVEDKKPADKPKFDSDSESENSDSAANIKRNGRKAPSKSASPEKKTLSAGGEKSSKSNASSVKSYDYMTKINYLFRDTRFFLIKSNNADNIAMSKSKNAWATLPQNDANLNQAFKEARNVLLIFSVNESGKFAGFARMSAPSRRDIPQIAWNLPPSISAKALGGVIEIDWICRKELSFNCTSHLYNSWNEGKPVKIGRDGQEIEPKVGAELCRLFPEDEKVELTPILRKSKETAKTMREKGIRVIYKAPRSLSTRGGRGPVSGSYRQGDRRSGSDGGAMRHRRAYGPPHRGLPYKPPPGMVYKRAMSPYRGSGPGQGGSGGGGGSRTGGGDAGLPPWERYMTSAAAAEAYVADYMRTMHGQLPPFPFVPPLGQLPLPGAGSGSGAMPSPGGPSIYEQLPPPVRYYDGPPLPDYPPPQPMRPPPPNFDKQPSYEDFAAWKNAGLPTVSGTLPPGFPNFGNSSLSSSNGGSGPSGGGGSGMFGSSSGGGNTFAGNSGSGSGPSSYRSSNNRSDNLNRGREQRGRDYHHRGGSSAGGSSRSGERDRHFRSGGASERGGVHYRQYRDSGGRR